MRRQRITAAQYYPFTSKRQHDAAKREADRQTAAARNAGVLTPKPCEVCGRRRVQAHHEDHAQPLKVRWLCRVHHARRHAELRELAKKQLAFPKFSKFRQPPPARSMPAQVAQTLAIRAKRAIASNSGVSYPVILSATEQLLAAIEKEAVSHNALAKRLGCSRQYLSAIFGSGLRTLRSLVTVADAVGYDVEITLKRKKVAA